jgi:DNA-binding GntR family transcriptional regulator
MQGPPHPTSRRTPLRLRALREEATLTDRAYGELRHAILRIPIYDDDVDLRLDERALAAELGISRTPVREALLRLEQEGIVRTIPRRGVYVVRKTKAEILEVILASAALESLAARLAAERATDRDLSDLRHRFSQFADADHPGTMPPVDEYSDVNLAFHQRIIDMARSPLLSQLIGQLQVHMRAIRTRAMHESNRQARSQIDHRNILAALVARDADLVEAEVRSHALNLARHVDEHVDVPQ